jgi:hypothetical protein
MSAQGNKNQQERVAKPTIKTVTVNAIVKSDKLSDYTVANPKGLHGAFVVALVNEKGLPDQFTFHHPIGWTDLTMEEYVCTPTSDIHTLLAGSEDPREGQLGRLENLVFLEFAVRDTLLFKGEGPDDPYVYPNGEDRDLILSRAEKAVRDHIKALEAEHKAKQQGKPKAAVFHHSVTRNMFLNEEHLAYERALTEHKRAVRAEIRERVPRTYRTLGGPLRDQPQRRCPAIPKGATEQEAKNAIYKKMASSFLAGSVDPVEVPAAAVTWVTVAAGRAPVVVPPSPARPTPVPPPEKVDPPKTGAPPALVKADQPGGDHRGDPKGHPGAPAISPRAVGGGELVPVKTRPASPPPPLVEEGGEPKDSDEGSEDTGGPEGGKPKGRVARAKDRLKASFSRKTGDPGV